MFPLGYSVKILITALVLSYQYYTCNKQPACVKGLAMLQWIVHNFSLCGSRLGMSEIPMALGAMPYKLIQRILLQSLQ